MADREGDDEFSLPKATVQKLMQEMLPADVTAARETRDLVIDCCVEFIRLVSSEANEICEKDSKKTIAAEHIIKALQDLGFSEYVESVQGVVKEHKEQQKLRERKQSKLDQSGMSQEELLRQQGELLNKARQRFQSQAQMNNNSNQGQAPSSDSKPVSEPGN